MLQGPKWPSLLLLCAASVIVVTTFFYIMFSSRSFLRRKSRKFELAFEAMEHLFGSLVFNKCNVTRGRQNPDSISPKRSHGPNLPLPAQHQ